MDKRNKEKRKKRSDGRGGGGGGGGERHAALQYILFTESLTFSVF